MSLPSRLDSKKRPAFNVASLYGLEGAEAELMRNATVPSFRTRESAISGLYTQMKQPKPAAPPSREQQIAAIKQQLAVLESE